MAHTRTLYREESAAVSWTAIATLSDTQLTQIAQQVFVIGDRATTRLPKPKTTGSDAFKAALDPIAAQADFSQFGIGVIDFTKDSMAPDVWLHNGDSAFRVGSATKIAILLAAVQLRLDVRQILALNIISTAADFDALFSNPSLWKKAKGPAVEMRAIAANPPLISKIFDFGKDPVDFAGPDPNGRKDSDDKPVAATQDAIVAKLPSGGSTWDKWTDFTFSERLWLAGCPSDDVAATACVSELGVPYIKAVQRSYGLADHLDGGMNLLLSSGYASIPASSGASAAKPPRQLPNPEPITVQDFWFSRKTGRFSDKRSWVPGSAAALTAYMIALMTDQFVNDRSLMFGQLGCDTIRKNLGDGGPYDADQVSPHAGAIHVGVLSVPDTQITRQIDKVGILGTAVGAKAALRCEFIYLETKQDPPPAAPARANLKYAIVATGVISEAATGGDVAATKSTKLGKAVHQALLTV